MRMIGTTRFEKALWMALQWHVGQKDKAGEPYITHLLRVAMQMETEDEQIVALLHDSLEDCPKDQVAGRVVEIEHAFGPDVCIDICALTKGDNEDYLKAYIPRVVQRGGIAVKVKVADIRDNMNALRLPVDITPTDVKRMQKYHRASMILHGCGVE